MFYYGSEQGSRWYDPVPKSWVVELRWIRDNVDLGPGRNVIDGGCHHGLYTVVMGGRCNIFAIDLHRPNLDILCKNVQINGIPNVQYGCAAIANDTGYVRFKDNELGAIDEEGDSLIQAVTLKDICADAHVVKLDIEGAEFLALPAALDDLPNVDTWIVEIHPWWFEASGNKDLFTPFLDRGFTLRWIDRADNNKARVKPLTGIVNWRKESTLIATL